jgi:hypothetical protein
MLSAAERAAHERFVAELGATAIWADYLGRGEGDATRTG